MNMLRTSVLLALLAGASAAATGADSVCDATLASHFSSAGTDCAESSGTCPSSCINALQALDTDCAGEKFSHSETRNGKDVEVALDWNTDKARYLILYQAGINFGATGSDDACNEVIHDYQLTHINDCNEAFQNAAVDLLFGHYCYSPHTDSTTCHVNCQETIDKLESVCNPVGGPLGKFYSDEDQDTVTETDDIFMENTYSSVVMLGLSTLGPASCLYTSSAPATAPPAIAAAGVVSSDPEYCPLVASSCWREVGSTCPTSSDCEMVSGTCEPKGWSTTHLSAMKWMDEKLVSSIHTVSYDSCLALSGQTCDDDDKCVWLASAWKEVYDAGSCAVHPIVAYNELDDDDDVPYGVQVEWFLEFHNAAVCELRDTNTCTFDKQCALDSGTCFTSAAYWIANEATGCLSQDFTTQAKDYGFTDMNDVFTKSGVTAPTCDEYLDFIKDDSDDCTAVSGVCPSTCSDLFSQYEPWCAGKKFNHSSPRILEPDLGSVDFDEEIVIWLIDWQYERNTIKDDACNEVIHQVQINSMDSCHEAYHNVDVDTLHGYYCSSPQSTATVCHEYCQESITKFDQMCNGTDNSFKHTGLDGITRTETYSKDWMDTQKTLSDAQACDYKYTGPCVASIDPANGAKGNCPDSLASGSTCQPVCNTGYSVSGTSSCSLGTFTAATCVASAKCAVNEYVKSKVCTACAAGSTNTVGDDASGVDTECDVDAAVKASSASRSDISFATIAMVIATLLACATV